MFKPITATTCNGNAIGRLILISGLVVLFSLILPATILAGPPLPHGTEECAGCHLDETTAWQNSPHAEAASEQGVFGVTCEGCHGAYDKKHPNAVDSSVCKACHTDTVKQWQDSSHAKAGLDCIECHLSHSQQFRLTDDEWCASCHRKQLEEPHHLTHKDINVTCANCHHSADSSSHAFEGVPSENCGTCHGQGIYAEECIDCHPQEATAWQDSPHAKAASHGFGATCKNCHGSFVENHPGKGVMQLNTDSSVCSDCHAETFEQWKNSPHAKNGVQCIGCHLSHSQDFRLTDETLCGSCHRDRLDDFSHSAHSYAEVTCIDCHLAPGPGIDETALVSAGGSGGTATKQVPNHNFAGVPSENCARCHGQRIHTAALHSDVGNASTVNLVAMADRVPELTDKLEAAQEKNESLQMLTLISLGGGLGIGGILGSLFVLMAGYLTRKARRKRRTQ